MNDHIAEGAVFYFKDVGIEDHFHIVVNVDASTSSALLIGVVTSHVAMRKQDAEENDESPDTIVDISPEQCPCLSHPSVVDCNEPLVLSRAVLQNLITTTRVEYRCNISRELSAKIRTGIRKSRNSGMDAKGLL